MFCVRAFDVMVYRQAVRVVVVVRLLSIIRLVLFCFFLDHRSDLTELGTRLVATILACTDLGALRLPAA